MRDAANIQEIVGDFLFATIFLMALIILPGKESRLLTVVIDNLATATDYIMLQVIDGRKNSRSTTFQREQMSKGKQNVL